MDASDLIRNVLEHVERNRQAILKDEIAKDPKAHKLTNMMADGKPANYRWYKAKNGHGHIVYFCYSVHRNLAGYFLGWRETYRERKDGTYATRDQWSARKTKKSLIELARRRRDRMAAKAKGA